MNEVQTVESQPHAWMQPIVGFHQDAESHWVADLACGHSQHVRHDPPWQNRPWVLTEASRQSYLGYLLRCRRCEPALSPALSGLVQPRLRVLVGDQIALGPGKAAVLQAIAEHGSLSQAARALNMSYRRLWALVDTMNQCFISPLVETQTGGTQGGGAMLTPLGEQVLQHYQNMQAVALAAIESESAQLLAWLKPLGDGVAD